MQTSDFSINRWKSVEEQQGSLTVPWSPLLAFDVCLNGVGWQLISNDKAWWQRSAEQSLCYLWSWRRRWRYSGFTVSRLMLFLRKSVGFLYLRAERWGNWLSLLKSFFLHPWWLNNNKVFIKCKILSVETILSMFTHTHTHTQRHLHTQTHGPYKIYTQNGQQTETWDG